MRGLRPGLIVVCAVLGLGAIAAADTLYLKNGGKFEGTLVEETADKVRFKTIGGVLEFPKSKVDRIDRGKTRADEFSERMKETAKDDVPALFELARWCEEQKLVSQRRRVLKLLAKQMPDHPEVRRGLGQIWRDGKWVRSRGKPPTPSLEAGAPVKFTGLRASATFPGGWLTTVTMSGAPKDEASATGPALYRIPPKISVISGPPVTDPAARFPEKDGWSKPEAVTVGDLRGFRARRQFTEERIDRVEVLALLGDAFTTVTIRLTALIFEEKTFTPAFDLVLGSLKLKPKEADYVNAHYGYAVDIPDGPRWEHGEDDEKDLWITRETQDDALEWCELWIITGNPGEEFTDVEAMFDDAVTEMKSGGDLTRDEAITVAGESARVVDGTLLEEGVPVRRRMIRLQHGKRIYVIDFRQHEYGQKRSDDAWTTVMRTFRFKK